MYTFFAPGDIYGLHISEIKGKLYLRLNKDSGTADLSLLNIFQAWLEQAERLQSDEITKEEYKDTG